MFPRFAFHQRDFLLLVKAIRNRERKKNSRGGGFFFEMEKLLIMGKGECGMDFLADFSSSAVYILTILRIFGDDRRRINSIQEK